MPEQVNQDDGLGPRSDCTFQGYRVHLVGVGIYVDENRHRARVGDGENGGNPRIGDSDDLVPRADSQRPHR